jgi:cytochrome b involved in lipid metabolism
MYRTVQTKFLEHHPGGADVMLEVAGQVADEFFEDIGHSNDARKELKKHFIGDFKMDAAVLAKMEVAVEAKAKPEEGGNSMILIILVALIAAYVTYTRMSLIPVSALREAKLWELLQLD